MSEGTACKFCGIAATAGYLVFEDDISFAFLDHRPLFIGHTLLVPREHYETLNDLPAALLAPFFGNVQMLARAVEKATEAEGTFVAINNRVSQSVPHLHVHIVPRRKKDGLRGFFWPRIAHPAEEDMRQAQAAIRRAIVGGSNSRKDR
ncbi:MAG TPA: HIT family protein [Bryobacteraceae bacterium]|nr:HIT family protein [Bryobacteraceae bacterium]